MFICNSRLFFVSALMVILASELLAWEYPTTKGRPALIVEVAPGVLFKGPQTTSPALYQSSDGVLSTPFSNTENIGWEPTVGMRASLQVMADNKQSMEFVYVGLYNWTRRKSSQEINGVGINTSPYETVDWASSDRIQWDIKTSFNSYDLCAWFHLTPRFEDYFSFSLLAGGRFINIVDTNTFFSFGATDLTIPSTDTDALIISALTSPASVLRAETDNWLRGGEIGFEVMCRPVSYFSWAIQLRGAGFVDDVSRSIYITDANNSVVIVDSQDNNETTRFSALGEFLPYVLIQNKQLYFRIMGTGTWIGNVSTTAPSFDKIRRVTDIKFQNTFTLAGGYVGIGYIF